MSKPSCRLQMPGATVLHRAEGDGPVVLHGYAAVFDSWTTLYKGRYWELREIIRPGAFRNALAERQDVRALYNHASDNLLGRTVSGTLRLREDARGLAVEVDPPKLGVGPQVVESIGRGDLSQMSFAFLPRKGGEVVINRMEGDLEITEVEIKDVDLFDVAPVTFPAYTDTSISLRSVIREYRAVTPAVLQHIRSSKGEWLKSARARSDAVARRLARA